MRVRLLGTLTCRKGSFTFTFTVLATFQQRIGRLGEMVDGVEGDPVSGE